MTAAISFECEVCKLLTISRATTIITFVGWSGILGLKDVVMNKFASVVRSKLFSMTIRDLCSKYVLASTEFLIRPVALDSLDVRLEVV